MKSQLFWKWTVGLSLGVLPLAGGCLQENPSPTVQSGSAITTVAETPVVYQAAPSEPAKADVAPAAEAPALTNPVEAKVEAVRTNQVAPAKVNLTPAAAELVKLANSGVDETVMLTYVTNSPSTFNLGADEIIYLNDLGVPGPVVTAMIQRDQVLKTAGEAAMAASSQANTPQQVQPMPAPETVAPQATAPPVYAAETPPPPPEGDVTTSTFYDSLSPYGTWIYVSGSGWCWRPTASVVNVGWEPYYNGGHWVYTDWGWYWVSDYSWGWAPFHYGRWFRHNHWGWCWMPDTVWGPSWVAWRYNDAYCGWAPLPPGAYFSFGIGLTYYGHPCHDWGYMGIGYGHSHFVAWRDFDRRDLHHHGAPHNEREAIYRNTTVVNNISIDNRTVINRGVPRERVAAVTHREVRPVSVRETGTSGDRNLGGRREQLRGNTLTVYRPAMAENRGEGWTAGGNRTRPEAGSRTSATSAPRAASSQSAPTAGAPAIGTSGLAAEPVRTRPATTRDRDTIATKPSTPLTQRLESPASVTRDSRVAPATRSPAPTGGSVSGPAPGTRSEPAVSRPAQAAPSQRPTQPVVREPARQPATEAPARSAPAPSRAPTPAPRSSAAPAAAPAPTYTATTRQSSTAVPQRSYSAPAYTAPQRSATVAPSVQREAVTLPRQTPTVSQAPRYNPAPAPAQVPRYNSAPAQPSYSAPQRSYSAPTRSESAPSVSAAPRYSPPAAAAPRASTPSQPAPSSSRSDSRGGSQR